MTAATTGINPLTGWLGVPACFVFCSTAGTGGTRCLAAWLFMTVLAISTGLPLIGLPFQNESISREYYILVGTVGTVGTQLI